VNRRALAAGLMLAATAATAPARADAINVVEIFNNFFEPQKITIAKGETVTWVSREGGHTVTANDDRFSFPELGTSVRGDTFSWTFHEDETFSYRCLVHGPGMAGVVVVGAGSPPPPPPPEPPRRVVPSADYPTIARALIDAEPTTIIEVLPGIYHYGVVVATSDVTIRGMGTSSEEVVIDGDRQRAVGIAVGADGVRVENLTVRNHGIAGLSFDGVARFGAHRIVAADNGSFGIRARGSHRGAIHASTASGASSAGLAIQDCDPCDIDVDELTAAANAVGALLENAGSIIVRRSLIRGNGAGIVLTGSPLEQRGAHLWGNTIADNADPVAPRSSRSVGAGIWIDGGSHNLLEHNDVSGHRYGIVVTGVSGPSVADRIIGNTIGDSLLGDLAWDGLGADVCLAGNARPDGTEPSADPPIAGTIYSCDLPHTVGVPWPAVIANMLNPSI